MCAQGNTAGGNGQPRTGIHRGNVKTDAGRQGKPLIRGGRASNGRIARYGKNLVRPHAVGMIHNQRASIQFHTAAKGVGIFQCQRTGPHFFQSSVPDEHVIRVPSFDITRTAQGQHVI